MRNISYSAFSLFLFILFPSPFLYSPSFSLFRPSLFSLLIPFSVYFLFISSFSFLFHLLSLFSFLLRLSLFSVSFIFSVPISPFFLLSFFLISFQSLHPFFSFFVFLLFSFILLFFLSLFVELFLLFLSSSSSFFLVTAVPLFPLVPPSSFSPPIPSMAISSSLFQSVPLPSPFSFSFFGIGSLRLCSSVFFLGSSLISFHLHPSVRSPVLSLSLLLWLLPPCLWLSPSLSLFSPLAPPLLSMTVSVSVSHSCLLTPPLLSMVISVSVSQSSLWLLPLCLSLSVPIAFTLFRFIIALFSFSFLLFLYTNYFLRGIGLFRLLMFLPLGSLMFLLVTFFGRCFVWFIYWDLSVYSFNLHCRSLLLGFGYVSSVGSFFPSCGSRRLLNLIHLSVRDLFPVVVSLDHSPVRRVSLLLGFCNQFRE